MSNRLSTNQWRTFAVFGAAMLSIAAAACASRALPASFPAAAAASPEAVAAPPARVGVALTEDPPMPGEPNARWPGLAAERSAEAQAHHQHRDAAPDGGSEVVHAR